MRTIAYALATTLVLASCASSYTMSGTPDAHTDAPQEAPECSTLWDCNPGVECGDMIPCMDGACRPDAPHVNIECPPPGMCATDMDCVVADPIDCCNGCPMAVLGSEIPECYYERGTAPPDPVPADCLILCYACPVCFPQPLGARCVDGECVPDGEGCPYAGSEEPAPATPAQVAADPLAYSGRTVMMTGSTMARWPVCDDHCPDGESCCDASLYLDGVVRLEGWPCEADLVCSSIGYLACDWDCRLFEEGASYEVVGEVRTGSTWDSTSVLVSGIREVDPVGLGGRYAVTVTSSVSHHVDPWGECPDFALVGETGEIVVADSSGEIVMRTGLFEAWGPCDEFWGSRDWSAFEVWVPIDCDGCCCDFWIDGRIEGGEISGTYHYFDGGCTAEVGFTGTRG